MTAPIIPIQYGAARKVCTVADFTQNESNIRLGPDGARWDRLTEDQVRTLANSKATYKHNSLTALNHLCASKGTWAFALPDGLTPQSVAFLYIKTPMALAAAAGGGGVTTTFTGVQLLAGYDRANRVWGAYVWKRVHANESAIEIAINFCLGG